MLGGHFRTGLTVGVAPPSASGDAPVRHITEEAAVTVAPGETLRVDVVAPEETIVAQGAPVARLRDHPDIALVAPMAGRVARVGLRPGRRLSEIVLFREAGGDRQEQDLSGVEGSGAGVRRLMQGAGLWPRLRRRPFGRMPPAEERPAAIFVMAADTRPLAPDPALALEGREEALARGLGALALLSDGEVFLCRPAGREHAAQGDAEGGARLVTVGPRHPQGLAGWRIHDLCPAGIDVPVWDIHAEDVADLGDLLATGLLPETRLVTVAGDAATEMRVLRCQPGADLRGLSHGAVRPGPHMLLAGSPLDGREARWLGPRVRQVTVLPQPPRPQRPHWFLSALTRSSIAPPVIPTAALEQAFGGAVSAAAMVRALASGDDETAMRFGVLSLLEEDVALADYVAGGEARLSALLRGMLDRIETEFAA